MGGGQRTKTNPKKFTAKTDRKMTAKTKQSGGKSKNKKHDDKPKKNT